MDPRCWRTFLVACLSSRALLLIFCVTAGIGLMPDEAQYWTWSRLLDSGYYSKPPGIAWQVAAGTWLFGPTVVGVRFIALLLPIASALVIRRIVLQLVDDSQAGWCAATAFILSPMGFVSSFLATTDSAMVLFALCALWWYLALYDQRSRFLAAGLCIGIAALWKWMAYGMWVALAADLIWRKKGKDSLFFFLGLALSLAGLLPALIWNWEHGWVTFRHAGAAIAGAHDTAPHPNPLSFFLAGIALVSPGMVFLALPALRSDSDKGRLLSFAASILWVAMLLLSCTRKMQGNWAVLPQVMLFPLLGVSVARRRAWQGRPLAIAIGIALAMQFLAMATPFLGKQTLAICPFKQGMGNGHIASTLTEAGFAPEHAFLFSDRYQTTSQLWFYGPLQQKAYFFNIHGLRQNQFCYWPGMEDECRGKDGWFVAMIPISEQGSVNHRIRNWRRALRPYFERLSKPIVRPLASADATPVRLMIMIPCFGYTGKTPAIPQKF